MRLPLHKRHAQTASRTPLALYDAADPGSQEHEIKLSSGKVPAAPADLAVQLLDGVVGAHASPVLARGFV